MENTILHKRSLSNNPISESFNPIDYKSYLPFDNPYSVSVEFNDFWKLGTGKLDVEVEYLTARAEISLISRTVSSSVDSFNTIAGILDVQNIWANKNLASYRIEHDVHRRQYYTSVNPVELVLSALQMLQV